MTLAIGTKVVCTYRVGSAIQPWMDNCWIGTIAEPNAVRVRKEYMSDAEYCAAYGESLVQYKSSWRDMTFSQIDSDESLIPVEDLINALLTAIGAAR